MKKNVAIVLACLVIAGIPGKNFAGHFKKQVSVEGNNFATVLNLALEENKPVKADASFVSAKALKDFGKSFKNVSGETWYQVTNKGFIANFKQNEIDTKVVYNEKGKWQYNLLTYTEDKLPFDIRHQVKGTYYDYQILVVNEFQLPGNDFGYIIKMQDKKHLKVLQIVDYEMTEIESYNRAN